MRGRYATLVSSHYRREEVFIRSTDRDRTLLSAHANFAAFYNASGTYVPVPIHTVPVPDDRLLRYPVTGCQKYEDRGVSIFSYTLTLANKL